MGCNKYVIWFVVIICCKLDKYKLTIVKYLVLMKIITKIYCGFKIYYYICCVINL